MFGSLHEAVESRKVMPPFWPFGKKKEPEMLDEPEPQTVVYRKGAVETQEVLADNSMRELSMQRPLQSLLQNTLGFIIQTDTITSALQMVLLTLNLTRKTLTEPTRLTNPKQDLRVQIGAQKYQTPHH